MRRYGSSVWMMRRRNRGVPRSMDCRTHQDKSSSTAMPPDIPKQGFRSHFGPQPVCETLRIPNRHGTGWLRMADRGIIRGASARRSTTQQARHRHRLERIPCRRTTPGRHRMTSVRRTLEHQTHIWAYSPRATPENHLNEIGHEAKRKTRRSGPSFQES